MLVHALSLAQSADSFPTQSNRATLFFNLLENCKRVLKVAAYKHQVICFDLVFWAIFERVAQTDSKI